MLGHFGDTADHPVARVQFAIGPQGHAQVPSRAFGMVAIASPFGNKTLKLSPCTIEPRNACAMIRHQAGRS